MSLTETPQQRERAVTIFEKLEAGPAGRRDARRPACRSTRSRS